MEEGVFSLSKCRTCFWQEAPACPRQEWEGAMSTQQCDAYLETLSDDLDEDLTP